MSWPRTTAGGMNPETGFRPELWRAIAPGDTPHDAGDEADLWLWMAGVTYDIL